VHAPSAAGSDIATAGLLWAACRADPDVEGIRAALAGGADADLAGSAAVTQRVAPLLWRGLRAAHVEDDGDQGERWSAVRQDSERWHARAVVLLPRAVATAVEPLAKAGLDPVVFKGPAMATRYPHPGLRPMDDLDLLLPRRWHDAALGALRAAGWSPARHVRQARYDVPLVHPDLPGFPLEMHYGFEWWRNRAHDLELSALWGRQVTFDCLGTPAHRLTVEDELVALAAHAAKPFHQFGRLIWSVDLAVLVTSAAGGIDWGAVEALSADTGCRTAVAVALRQASRLGADAPADLLAISAKGARRAALDPLLSENWPLIDLDPGLQRRLRYALCDDARRRAVLFAGQVTEGPWWQAPGRAMSLGTRAVRRWFRLRRSAQPR
jgi:hypothetical protein